MYRYRLWKRLPGGLGAELDRLNRRSVPTPPMDQGIRRWLSEVYADDIAQVRGWLGRVPVGWPGSH